MLREFCDLNAFQNRFVEADIGTMFLSGGAGTGKTWAVICRILKMMLSGYRPDDVVLLTPHDHQVSPLKSALEDDMPARFRNRRHLLEGQGWDLGQLSQAVDLAAQVFVGTVFQYTHRLLREHGGGPSTVWSDAEAIAVIAGLEVTVARDYGIAYEKKPGSAREFFEWQVILKSRLPGSPRMHVPVDGWRELAQGYLQEQNLRMAVDRHDLLVNAYKLVAGWSGGRGTGASEPNRHILVDNFEDIPEMAFWCLDALCGLPRSLSVAVDPGQPPMGNPPLRPLDVFMTTYPTAHQYPLQFSHRVRPPVVSTLRHIAAHSRQHAATLYLGFVEPTEPESAVTLHVVSGRANLETGHVYRLIQDSLDRRLGYSDIAVVYPDNGNANSLAALLWVMRVPFSMDPSLGSPAETRNAPGIPGPRSEAEQIIDALRVLANPFDPAAFMDLASIGLGPDRPSLRPDELVQVTGRARNQGINLIEAARRLIQTRDRRRRLYHILTPLLNLHAALEQAAREANGPDAVVEIVESARRIMAAWRVTPPTPRDEIQVGQLLHLCGQYRRHREETTTQVLQRFLDRFSPGLHPRSSPLQGGGFAHMDHQVTITTSEGAVGGGWPHVIALTSGQQLGQAMALHLFRAASATDNRLDIIGPSLLTGGRDAATEAAVRDALGADVQVVDVSKEDVDPYFREV